MADFSKSILIIVCCMISERSKRVTVKGDEPEKKDEEDWPLKDVIFVEDVKNFPVGMFSFFCPCSSLQYEELCS